MPDEEDEFGEIELDRDLYVLFVMYGGDTSVRGRRGVGGGDGPAEE